MHPVQVIHCYSIHAKCWNVNYGRAVKMDEDSETMPWKRTKKSKERKWRNRYAEKFESENHSARVICEQSNSGELIQVKLKQTELNQIKPIFMYIMFDVCICMDAVQIDETKRKNQPKIQRTQTHAHTHTHTVVVHIDCEWRRLHGVQGSVICYNVTKMGQRHIHSQWEKAPSFKKTKCACKGMKFEKYQKRKQ